MFATENFCVGCETCVHCGNKHIKTAYCDYCGSSIDNTKLYHIAGKKMACKECVVNLFIEDGEVAEIPFDDEYIYDGKRYSLDDLADRLAEELDEVEV